MLVKGWWASAVVQESSTVVTALRASPSTLWSHNTLHLTALMGREPGLIPWICTGCCTLTGHGIPSCGEKGKRHL